MFEVNFLGFDIVDQIKDNALHLLGICSAFLSIFAFLPYARDTLRGRTQPQRASWLIWSVLSTISFASQVAEGASSSLWFLAIQCSGTVFIFGLSCFRGQGRFFRTADLYTLAIAAFGVAVWMATNNPTYALTIIIAISLLGGIPTVQKSYCSPETETRLTWSLSFCASIFAILSVGTLDWTLLAYPLYLFTLDGAILCAMVMGRGRQHRITRMALIRLKAGLYGRPNQPM